MCPYMLVKENNVPYCEPKNNVCTMCVAGNMKIYKEIENETNEYNRYKTKGVYGV